jgi:PAS domain S-box-containing protein
VVSGARDRPLVLIVEDNVDMNRFIAENLAEDHRVASAFDGEEGIERALHLQPDLILTDLMMPRMSGEALVRAVRRHSELNDTPIIVLSAKSDEFARLKPLREGAQDFLTKPFSVEELRARIENLISKRKAEALVRQAEVKFRGIISAASDAIIGLDEEHRVVIFNEGAEAVFGWNPSEILGERLDRLFPQPVRENYRRILSIGRGSDTVRRRSQRFPLNLVGLRQNGEQFPAEATTSSLDLGGTKLLTVILRDVTERKRSEKRQLFLAEAGSILGSTLDLDETLSNVARLVVRDVADCCVVRLSGADGHAARVKVLHSDPAKSAAARVLEDILIDRPNALFLPERKEPLLMSDVGAGFLEAMARNADDIERLRQLDLHSAIMVPLRLHGRMLGALSLLSSRARRLFEAQDLSLAKELAIRTAFALENATLYEKARRSTALRDEVLGVVAHDLRNPLSNILLQASVLRQHGAEQDRRSQRSAQVIERAASRMNRLIQDLLDVTRMEAGRLSVERERTPVEDLVRDVAEAQRAHTERLYIALRTDLRAEVGTIWADRDRLQQVFENLISNAVKFTKAGGHIVVGAAPREGEVLFWVSDTGAGIATEDLQHVFERFWQGRRAARHGAGLGLPIVKGIVEAHGGRVWAESTLGRGSIFFFAIPTSPPAEDRRNLRAPNHGT